MPRDGLSKSGGKGSDTLRATETELLELGRQSVEDNVCIVKIVTFLKQEVGHFGITTDELSDNVVEGLSILKFILAKLLRGVKIEGHKQIVAVSGEAEGCKNGFDDFDICLGFCPGLEGEGQMAILSAIGVVSKQHTVKHTPICLYIGSNRDDEVFQREFFARCLGEGRKSEY